MKKYLVFELKKILLPLIALTAIMSIVYIITMSNIWLDTQNHIRGAFLEPILWPLLFASLIVPMFVFSFKNDPRALDCIYTLPINRKKIYLVKSIVAVVLVLVSFVISFWLGILTLAFRAPTNVNFIYYLPTFLIFSMISVLVIGLSSFMFTRANRNIDGAIFVVFGLFALLILVAPFITVIEMSGTNIDIIIRRSWLDVGHYNLFALYQSLINTMERLLIIPTFFRPVILPQQVAVMVTVGIIFFVACILFWVGLIFTPNMQKAEEAGNDSNSLFGYKTFIPFMTISLMATVISRIWIRTAAAFIPITIIVSTIIVYVIYIIYRRSFKIKKVDLILGVSSILIGVLLGVIGFLIINWGWWDGTIGTPGFILLY